MRAAALLAVLAGTLGVHSGCSGRAELEDYCERSGDCRCSDGACCAIAGQPCTTGMSCCDGYACIDGACGWGPVPQVRFDPVAIDFGHTDRVASPPWPFTLINVGTVATHPLDFYPTEIWNFAIESACIGAVLQPGERCTGSVTFLPHAVNELPVARTFSVREVVPRLPPRPVISLTATGRAGHLLKVSLQDAAVTVDGVTCQARWWPPCTFPFDVPSVASVVSTPLNGFHLETVAGGCATSPCEVHVQDIVEVRARGRGNLHVTVTSSDGSYGGVYILSEAVSASSVYCSTHDGSCDAPASGSTRLTMSPSGAWDQPIAEWGGACLGATGPTCSVDVAGPTTVTLHLRR